MSRASSASGACGVKSGGVGSSAASGPAHSKFNIHKTHWDLGLSLSKSCRETTLDLLPYKYLTYNAAADGRLLTVVKQPPAATFTRDSFPERSRVRRDVQLSTLGNLGEREGWCRMPHLDNIVIDHADSRDLHRFSSATMSAGGMAVDALLRRATLLAPKDRLLVELAIKNGASHRQLGRRSTSRPARSRAGCTGCSNAWRSDRRRAGRAAHPAARRVSPARHRAFPSPAQHRRTRRPARDVTPPREADDRSPARLVSRRQCEADRMEMMRERVIT